MPYKVVARDGKFDVVNAETEEVKATKETRDEADQLVHMLTELEKEGEDEL
jgi:hypothetical protein